MKQQELNGIKNIAKILQGCSSVVTSSSSCSLSECSSFYFSSWDDKKCSELSCNGSTTSFNDTSPTIAANSCVSHSTRSFGILIEDAFLQICCGVIVGWSLLHTLIRTKNRALPPILHIDHSISTPFSLI